jgi:hypothetical protein
MLNKNLEMNIYWLIKQKWEITSAKDKLPGRSNGSKTYFGRKMR